MAYPSASWISRASANDSDQWKSVCYSPALNLYVAVGQSGTGTRVMTSPDGIAWTARTSAADYLWSCVCWSPELELFCAVSSNGTTTGRCMTSPDGITWTLRAASTAHSWYGLCWSPELSLFVAVGGSGTSNNRCMTSPDGITWTLRTTPTGATYSNWTSVCWSSDLDLLVAVADNGNYRCMTSPDGITWTNRSINTSAGYGAVCWSPALSLFCAVNDYGMTYPGCATSSDGVTWTDRSFPNTNYYYAVEWCSDGGFFIAVGASSTALSSADGITWTERTAAANLYWKSVCQGSGKLVAVADSGTGNRVMTLQTIPPDWVGQPTQSTLTLTGANPVFVLHIPMTVTASQLMLDLAGQTPSIVLRTVVDTPKQWVSTRYRCTLNDLLLPISSFQCRLRVDGLSAITCVLNGADAYVDAIALRSTGILTIFREYVLADGSISRYVMASGTLERLDVQQGGRAGMTGTLTATGNFEPDTTETITLTDPTYYAQQSGQKRYRCAINPNLRPGDTALINNDSLVVGDIIYIVDVKTAIMEIAEV
jgi:hypothetical protein